MASISYSSLLASNHVPRRKPTVVGSIFGKLLLGQSTSNSHPREGPIPGAVSLKLKTRRSVGV
jgi:hypothetical protein